MQTDDLLLCACADQLHAGHLLALRHGVVERAELGRVDLEGVCAVLLLGLLLGQADGACENTVLLQDGPERMTQTVEMNLSPSHALICPGAEGGN